MIKYFKSLNSGLKRLFFIGTFILAPLIGLLFVFIYHDSFMMDFFIFNSILIGIPSYWIVLFAILWIVQGFEKDKRNK